MAESEDQMQHEATKLDEKQEQAAELLASGGRMGDVAATVGCNRATLWRWTQEPAFRDRREELRRQAWACTRDRLAGGVPRAVDALLSILENDASTSRDRIAAARTILTAAGPIPTPVVRDPAADWRARVLETASKAAEMEHGDGGRLYTFAYNTPRAAWKAAGLEAALPGAFERIRALQGQPEQLRAACAEALEAFADYLDRDGARGSER
jgi:hypothetical protein